MDLLGYLKSNVRRIKKSTTNYHNEILNSIDANSIIGSYVNNNTPAMISRIGSVELECLVDNFKGKGFSESTIYKMANNAGFFPSTSEKLVEFSSLFSKCLSDADLMGIWYNNGEDKIINKYCPEAKLCELRNLEPYYHSNPWTQYLENKSVLVIHPFVETIEEQYNNNRHHLFEQKELLPQFNLLTLRAVQTISGNNDGFLDWFEALEYMKNKIDSYNYDVAIIGAGAYGLPLASHIKNQGKISIHLGGATQIMFGVKGKRWDNHPVISKLYNDYWTRANENERPKDYKKVEGGCYW